MPYRVRIRDQDLDMAKTRRQDTEKTSEAK